MKHFHIGKILGTHGFKGDVVLSHALSSTKVLKHLKVVFTEDKKDSFMPWFVEAVRSKNDQELYLKIEGMDAKEKAKLLNRKEIWITESDFNLMSEKNTAINLLNYTILQNKKVLGTIVEIIEQPNQILAKIFIDDKEVYIPLHEETLINIHHQKKQVEVELPEGLLEIYLD
ncbi:MAG: 16S rRNA processing protein RimM [Chitinophagaceae bacterium]|nr:MAG: 16S rRNA processing protein RimM [Chitinophagaceae bacterium]